MTEVSTVTPEERSRRNVRLALAHAAVAVAMMVAYVWFRVTHG